MSHAVNQEYPLSQLVFLGAMRSAGGFLFEHPLELMKVKAQANPRYSSLAVVQSIFKEKGILGFSNTALTNFPRRLLRESIRWPVIGYTHEQLIKNYPKIFTKEGTNAKIVTGISIALFDSLVILPLEQLMAYRVKEREPYTTFFKKRFAQDGIRSLYRGIGVNFLGRGLVWTTFMVINNESKKRFDLLDQDKKHPYLRQAVTSIFIAAGLTACMPVDFVKVRIQMDTDLQNIKLSSAARKLLGRHSLSSFYAGALPAFIHTVFHATLGGYILDRIFASEKIERRS